MRLSFFFGCKDNSFKLPFFKHLYQSPVNNFKKRKHVTFIVFENSPHVESGCCGNVENKPTSRWTLQDFNVK